MNLDTRKDGIVFDLNMPVIDENLCLARKGDYFLNVNSQLYNSMEVE
jgi:hypothetical protein